VYFLRILGLTLTPPPPEGQGLAVDLGDVSVEITAGPERHGGRWYRAVGRVKLKRRPKRTSAGGVVVPDEAREAARRGLEIAANAFALGVGSRRSLSSPNPYAAFEAESDEERVWLSESVGLDGGLDGTAIGSVHNTLDMSPEVMNSLTDRWDGVALLAEALAAERKTGRFIDLMRLFERAFRLSPGKLAKPLTNFLEPKFGYDEKEVTHWTDKLRGGAAHADRRATFLMEADVRPYLHRAEQAAWDVLLNKAEWRRPSTTRRAIWNPTAGTTAPKNGLTGVVGSTLPLLAELLDRWEEFPLDLESRAHIPETWWPPASDRMGTAQHSFQAVAPDEW
jgi:hypothetical protein